jgi:RNA polymerase sigma factor (sigma-70 family)
VLPGTRGPLGSHHDDHVEFDATFDEIYPRLVRYCHRLTGDRDAAEDAAQEAMVRLFTHAVDGPVPALRAWAFKTATHLIRDRYRVDENRRRLLQQRPVASARTEDPERSLERSEDAARARAALESLAPRDQEILLMRYEGFSYKEIAGAVEVASTSVGTLLARAERRFHQALTGAQDEA